MVGCKRVEVRGLWFSPRLEDPHSRVQVPDLRLRERAAVTGGLNTVVADNIHITGKETGAPPGGRNARKDVAQVFAQS